MKQLCITFAFASLISLCAESWMPLIAFLLFCILGACVAIFVAIRRSNDTNTENTVNWFVSEKRFDKQHELN